MSKTNRFAQAIMQSPILWGMLASLGFYSLIFTGALQGEFIHRYFASNWVLCATTSMFFVGVAQLVLKACEVADQRHRMKQPFFADLLPATNAVDEANVLLEQLDKLPAGDQRHYLPQRLRDALESVRRKGGASWLDEDLKYLSELDEQRSAASYGLVKMIIWAIPILGFLGTVIGITIAIARLSPQELEGSLSQVTDGLGIAFDTTALALALSMALMFLQFLVDRLERRLLADIDVQAVRQLEAHFGSDPVQRDHQLAAVQRMAETVVQATERTVQRQAQIWQSTINTAHERWQNLTTTGQQTIELALGTALNKSIDTHAKRLVEAEQTFSDHNREHWQQLQQSLEESVQKVQQAFEAGATQMRETLEQSVSKMEQAMQGASRSTQQALSTGTTKVEQALATTTSNVQDLLLSHTHSAKRQQQELTRTSDVLLQVVRATGEISRLQDALNRNLNAVSSAQTLEETLLNLSAAIGLLNARLSSVAPQQITLQAKATDKAA